MKNLSHSFLSLLLFANITWIGSQMAKAETISPFSHDVVRVVSGFTDPEWIGYSWDLTSWSQIYQMTFEGADDGYWSPYIQQQISLSDKVLGWFGTNQSENGWTDVAQFDFNGLNEEMNTIRITFTLIQHGTWSEAVDDFFVTDGNGNQLLNFADLNNEESYSAQNFELIFPNLGGETLTLFFQSFFEDNTDAEKLWGINDFTIYQGQTSRIPVTPEPASALVLGLGALTLCGIAAKRKKFQ